MSSDSIERETLIAAPVERVWAVLTEAEHLGGWFAGAGAEIDLRPGGALVLHWEEQSSMYGRVEVVEPPQRFAYRWTAFHAMGEEPVAGNSTLVEFTLTPEGDGTRLRVLETGFDGLDVPVGQQAEDRSANTKGWGEKVAQLDAYATRVAA